MQACIKTKRSAAVTSRHREPFNTCSVKQLKWAPDLMIVGGGSLESGAGSLGQGAGSLTRGAGSQIRRDPAEFKPWINTNLSVDKGKCSESEFTLIYTLTLKRCAQPLQTCSYTPRDVQSLSLDLSLLIICAIELTFSSSKVMRFISSSEKRGNPGIILILTI